MSYRGDSSSKKLARIQHWLRVRDLLGDRFLREKHLVLASQEGGDISALLGLGVHPNNIVAVDHDPDVIWNLPDKFPEVRPVFGDVFEVGREMGRKLGSAFLDFCGQPNPEVLTKVCQLAAHGLRDDAVLSVGFMRGREKGSAKEMLDQERWAAVETLQKVLGLPHKSLTVFMYAVIDMMGDRTEASELKKLLSDPGKKVLSETLVRKYLAEDMVSDSEASMTIRSWALSKRLIDEGLKIRCYMEPDTSIFYTSATEESRGTPMQILVCWCRRMNSREKVTPFTAHYASRGPDLRTFLIDPKKADMEAKDMARSMALGQDASGKECVRRVMNMTLEEFAEAIEGDRPRRRVVVPSKSNVAVIDERNENEKSLFTWADGGTGPAETWADRKRKKNDGGG